MVRWAAVLLLLVGCKKSGDCFGDDQCASGRCNFETFVCVPLASDAGGDAGRDAGGDDAGTDAGTDGLHPAETSTCNVGIGAPHEDGDYGFGEWVLFHMDEPITVGVGARNAGGSPDNPPATCLQCPSMTCGAYGGAASMDGNGDHLNVVFGQNGGALFPVVASDVNTSGTDYTAELWIRSTDGTDGCLMEVLEGQNPTEVSLCLSRGRVRWAAGTQADLTSEVLPEGRWTHVAARREHIGLEANYTLMIDGVVTATASGASRPTAFGDALRIGFGFRGAIDEVRLVNFPTLDEELSVNRSPGCLTYNVDGDRIFFGDGRANRPIELPFRGSIPRLSADGSVVAYLSCASTCDLVIRRTSDLTSIATSANVTEAQGAFIGDGGFLYIRGGVVQLMPLDTGIEVTPGALPGNFAALDVGLDGTGRAVLVGIMGDGSVRAFANPLDFNNVEELVVDPQLAGATLTRVRFIRPDYVLLEGVNNDQTPLLCTMGLFEIGCSDVGLIRTLTSVTQGDVYFYGVAPGPDSFDRIWVTSPARIGDRPLETSLPTGGERISHIDFVRLP